MCIQSLLSASNIITHLQHGFLKGRSTTSQLLNVYRYILDFVAGGTEVGTIYLDLTRAFDTVPHNLMFMKLENYLVKRCRECCLQTVVLDKSQN